MGTRKFVFTNGEIYHVFNRGVEKRPTFTTKRDFQRALETISYYRYKSQPLRFSHFLRLSQEAKFLSLRNMASRNKEVELFSACLMPNHFHFLLRQLQENGVSKFAANFTNSYTKYFNTKHERVGPLFQGAFQAVRIEDDEQLLHASRYIHLNPVSSFLVEPENLELYPWSSYPEYIGLTKTSTINKDFILGFFNNNIDSYKKFVLDRAAYARDLERIKHLTLE